MVTAQVYKWLAPVEVKMSASDLEHIATFFEKSEVQELLKDAYAMQSISKQIVSQSEKVQNAINPPYPS